MNNYAREDGMLDINPMMGGFVAGLLIGGLAGALTMLLMAPQSGEHTRRKIRRKALEFRDQVADSAEEARDRAEQTLDAARDRVDDVKHTVRDRADDVQQRGQDLLDQQRERVDSAVQAGKTAIRRR
jgi:gas vesicle protein